MDALFRIVNDFDKVEGYEKWLDSQVPNTGLDVVDEESSGEDLIEERKFALVKPLNLQTVKQVMIIKDDTAAVLELKTRSV